MVVNCVSEVGLIKLNLVVSSLLAFVTKGNSDDQSIDNYFWDLNASGWVRTFSKA